MRIGQILAEMAHWTHHEVEEILYEQTGARQRFGDIAVALGYCDADQVRRASVVQLAGRPQQVDLRRMGVDAQSLCFLPAALAKRFGAIPIRIADDQLIVATDMPADHPGRAILKTASPSPCVLSRRIRSRSAKRLTGIMLPCAPADNPAGGLARGRIRRRGSDALQALRGAALYFVPKGVGGSYNPAAGGDCGGA